MRTVSPVNLGELLNLVGLSTGVALYAMLLAMVIRARRHAGTGGAVDPLLLLTSILGLVWNLCALPGYVLPKFGIEGPFSLVSAIGFGALGLLPAVVVHSVLRGGDHAIAGVIRRMIGVAAYAVSGFAAMLQLAAAFRGAPVPSADAMRLLTYAFVALVVPLAAATRGQPGSRRALWVAALAVFAVSALHLSQLHSGNPSWLVELLGHHASLPLALAILYQDYPFALADLFLKRALALLAVVAIAFVSVAAFGDMSAAFAQFIERDPRQFALLITLWVATALLYPWMRAVIAWFVDAVLLHRPNYRALRASVSRAVQTLDAVPLVLEAVADVVGTSLNSARVTWQTLDETRAQESPGMLIVASDGITSLTIPTAEAPRYVLVIAPLTGGRRLLSDDVAMLEAMATIAARRIDAIRVTQERHEREIREREMGRLATEAELRALRAQINPHFLFNALTTIGYLIQTAPPRALQTLLRLTSLLRGVLRSEGEFTTLGREVDIIEAYLDIERARFEQRLRVSIDVPARLRNVRVPALMLQPLVENAVKHGVAPMAAGGEVEIHARIDPWQPGARRLTITIRDTGAGVAPDQLRRGREEGVGLRNVERRLHGQYGDAASLVIDSTPGQGTTVEVRLPVTTRSREDARERVAV
jgi:two-component system LytT family sensor kinase